MWTVTLSALLLLASADAARVNPSWLEASQGDTTTEDFASVDDVIISRTLLSECGDDYHRYAVLLSALLLGVHNGVTASQARCIRDCCVQLVNSQIWFLLRGAARCNCVNHKLCPRLCASRLAPGSLTQALAA